MRALLLVVALLATAALAGGLVLQVGVRFEFTDCAAGGSAAQTVTEGQYLMRVTDSDAFLCYGATCAAGGEKFPAGAMLLLSVGAGGQQMSCRSASSLGDVILTRAN